MKKDKHATYPKMAFEVWHEDPKAKKISKFDVMSKDIMIRLT